MPDLYSHWLDDDNNPKPLSDLEILQLDEDFLGIDLRSKLTEFFLYSFSKKSCENKHPHDRVLIACKMILKAGQRVIDNMHENQGIYNPLCNSASRSILEQISEDQLSFLAKESGVNWLQERTQSFLLILKRMRNVLQGKLRPEVRKEADPLNEYNAANFSEWIMYLSGSMCFTLDNNTRFIQGLFLTELRPRAADSNEFCLLAKLENQWLSRRDAHKNLAMAVSLGNVYAVFDIAESALYGYFIPRDKAIDWALDALFVLEFKILPFIEDDNQLAQKFELRALYSDTLLFCGQGYDRLKTLKNNPEEKNPVDFPLAQSAEFYLKEKLPQLNDSLIIMKQLEDIGKSELPLSLRKAKALHLVKICFQI